MNKKIVKIIMIAMILILVTLICSQASYALQGDQITKVFDGDSSNGTKDGEGLIKKVIGPILSAVRIIATGVSIIMITFLGIKYMAAAPTEKASIKNQLITFTIGAAIVVGTTSLLDIIKNFATSATT